LLVRRPKTARTESPWAHCSLDAQLESGGCLLDQLEAPAPAGELQPQPLDPALEALLDHLPAAQAASLRLTILEGLSLRQAAKQLGISPMSVQRAQKKALDTLRQQVSA
jgi:RNA polymerase sigma-B factor